MKTTFKTLFASALLAVFASHSMAEEYVVQSVDGTAKLTVTLQGGGVAKIPGPGIPLEGGFIRQRLNLHPDHTMTGSIYYAITGEPDNVVFELSGSWYRPEGGKVIYYAVDGDPTKGADSDGTYGALFDQGKAKLMSLQNFMPLLFSSKVASIEPIFPMVKLKTGLIKLSLDKNGNITKASTDMTITGRAMVNYCKMDKAPIPGCTIPNGVKDATFGFSSVTKSTVSIPVIP